MAAGVLGGSFVVAHTFRTGSQRFTQTMYLEILATAGAILTVAAVSLTGNLESPFLLLALTPTLLASIIGGRRVGVTTSLLSSGLLTAVAATSQGLNAVIARAGSIVLFPLTAMLVAQIRSLLIESENRATSLLEASAEAEAELVRLSRTNELLRRLTDAYGEGRASPVELGRTALQAIVDTGLASFATATLFDYQGPVVVARVGTDAPDLIRAQIPLGEGETSSGVVSLATTSPLTHIQRQEVDILLRPVAVAFANAVLLQDIAATAVREERLRLARELHDEVGPALSALGLSLDAAQIETHDEDLKQNIGYVREGLGTVIDDLRGIIADLRAESSPSLLTSLRNATSELSEPPTISIDIHERRPPRARAMRQILAIVSESVRNAHRHAGARSVRVGGTVDRSMVVIEVTDDGRGFDPNDLPDGRFGVLGMKERADRIGATLDIDSTPAGTSLRLVWKELR